MDPETLTALADSLEQHRGRLAPDLGPYLDAACEAIERAGGRTVVAVVECKVAVVECKMDWRWHSTTWSPRYDPPIEASGELSRLVGALAMRIASHAYPRGELSVSHRMGRVAFAGLPWEAEGERFVSHRMGRVTFSGLPWEAEVVIDSQRKPRATFHQSLRELSEYPLVRRGGLFQNMKRSAISMVQCEYQYDRDGLRFIRDPESPLAVLEPSPTLREMIRDRLQETLDRAARPAGSDRAYCRVCLSRPPACARVYLHACTRGEVLAKVD